MLADFFKIYGHIHGNSAKNWTNKNIAENYDSVTYSTFRGPTRRKNR